MPRLRSSATASSRATGLGVCRSVARHASSSNVGTERFTDTLSPASTKRSKISTSRITSGDLVSTETGVRAASKASRISGSIRYLLSHH